MEPGKVLFYPIHEEERQVAGQMIETRSRGVNCGACGLSCVARVVAACKIGEDERVLWLLCPCPKQEPMTLTLRGEHVIKQSPIAREFVPNPRWPYAPTKLYEEASSAFSAGSYTATAMVARRILATVAVEQGADDGKPFAAYVDHIVNTVLTYPKAKTAIDQIRKIGNDANHKSVEFVFHNDAKRAMEIVTYMLDAIYSLPNG